MKTFAIFVAYLPSLAAVVAAVAVAFTRGEGWGWFLLAAVVLIPKVREFIIP